MRTLFIFVTLTFFLSKLPCNAQEVFRSVHSYYTLDSTALEMDYYFDEQQDDNLKPTIIFVHGGSFMVGDSRLPYIIPYAMAWVKSGYNFISINYRLTLKGKSFHCDLKALEKIKTIEHAVYDLRAATRFVIDHYDRLRVDTNRIIIAGNSAGAETVLHAAYWRNDEHNLAAVMLSNSFRYAGVLAYAGAIVDTSLIQPENVIPTAVFHGTCDQYVPYATATHHYCPENTPGALLLQGSSDIAKRITHLNGAVFLYTVVWGNHRINTLGMLLPLEETILFVNETVLQQQQKQVHLVERSSEEKCTFVETDICD